MSNDSSSHLPPTHQRSLSMSAPSGSNSNMIVDQMAQRIVALEQQVLANSKVSVPSVKKPAIPNPKQFTGETTGTYTIDEWIDDVEKQIRHHNSYFVSDAIVVDWASSYLSGKANGWWKSTQEERRVNGQLINTWVEMKRELLERFHPIEAATLARMALDKMQQKGTVQSYTEYFYKQMNYIKDMSVSDQLHCYTRGLKVLIRGEVLKAKPTTIHEAVNIANTAESLLNMAQPHPKYTTGNRFHGTSSSSSSHGTSVPMELSNVNQHGTSSADDGSQVENGSSSSSSTATSLREQQLLNIISELQKGQVQRSINAMFNNKNSNSKRNANRIPNVSKEDYERCRSEGLCINCKKSGHIARDCTNNFSLKY